VIPVIKARIFSPQVLEKFSIRFLDVHALNGLHARLNGLVVAPTGKPLRVNAELSFWSQKLDGTEGLTFKYILNEERFHWSRGVGKPFIFTLPLKGNPYGNVQTEWNALLQFVKIVTIC
jgi:hypothetical protein